MGPSSFVAKANGGALADVGPLSACMTTSYSQQQTWPHRRSTGSWKQSQKVAGSMDLENCSVFMVYCKTDPA
jgi:hypothetical protein